jgi:hypothetical protein
MEFKKYFVDEFNELLQEVGSDDRWSFYVEILIHLCFFNPECPDEYIREVLTNPKYLRGFFAYDEIPNDIDEEIKMPKKCLDVFIFEKLIKNYQPKELKRFSRKDASNLKKLLPKNKHSNFDKLDLMRQYKLFK